MRVFTALMMVVLPAGGVSAQEPLPRWMLVPEMRIGAVDDGPYALNEVNQITISPATESVFVGMYGEIRAFSPDGRFLRALGGRGSGPGEFVRLSGLSWTGDTLVALKPTPGSAMRFSEEGRLLDDRVIEVTAGIGVGLGYPVAALGAGHYLWRGFEGPEAAIANERPLAPLVRTDGNGGDHVLDQLVQEGRWRAGPVGGPHPLASISYVAANPSGTAVAIVHQQPAEEQDGAWFRVRMLDGAGRVVFARSYSFRPKAVPPTYVDSLIRIRVEAVQAIRSVPGLEATVRQIIRTPRYQPAITGVVLSEEGSVWLRREDVHTDSVAWWVLDPRGDLVAELMLPSRRRVLYVNGDTVWGVEFDALNVPYAVKYRIRK